MGERAKIIVNEYTAIKLLKRSDLNLDKFYNSDLKIFVKVAQQEIERLNNENNFLKQLIPSDKTYSYGIRVNGGDE